MCKISLDSPQDTSVANRIFKARSCITAMATLGLIGTIITLAVHSSSEAEGVWWKTNQEWFAYDDTSFMRSVCGKNMSVGQECGLDWETWQGEFSERCYKLVVTKYRFQEAKKNCREVGGELASIPDPAANPVVHRICGDSQPCWIGAEMTTSGWSWIDGTKWYSGNWGNWLYQNAPVGTHVGMGIPNTEDVEKAVNVVGGLVALIISIVVVAILCGVCWGFFTAASGKNDPCLVCTVVCDGICICLGVLGVIGSVSALAEELDGGRVIEIIARLVTIVLFVIACVWTVQLRNSLSLAQINRQQAASASSPAMVVGVPVTGQPVVGTVAQAGTCS